MTIWECHTAQHYPCHLIFNRPLRAIVLIGVITVACVRTAATGVSKCGSGRNITCRYGRCSRGLGRAVHSARCRTARTGRAAFIIPLVAYKSRTVAATAAGIGRAYGATAGPRRGRAIITCIASVCGTGGATGSGGVACGARNGNIHQCQHCGE